MRGIFKLGRGTNSAHRQTQSGQPHPGIPLSHLSHRAANAGRAGLSRLQNTNALAGPGNHWDWQNLGHPVPADQGLGARRAGSDFLFECQNPRPAIGPGQLVPAGARAHADTGVGVGGVRKILCASRECLSRGFLPIGPRLLRSLECSALAGQPDPLVGSGVFGGCGPATWDLPLLV